jgi:4-hydroxybenzoate polyprenyltransferase
LGVSLGLAPIAGVVAVEAAISLWSIYLSVGVLFWVAGFDLLYSLQDIEFDKAEGLHSIPSRFGAKNTFRIAQLFHVFTIVFWALFVIEAKLDIFAYLAVLFATFMLAYEHYLVSQDFSKINKAFFTINGYLGIIFILLIIIEKVLI